MNLVLWSSEGKTPAIEREVIAMVDGKQNPLITFIPSDSEDFRKEYAAFKRKFRRMGFERFNYLLVDKKLSASKKAALLKSDAIFLGGGNTFYFLKHLREQGLLSKLRAYAKRGGLLLGLSAGSIMMTANIKTAEVPSEEADDNDVGLTNLNALNLAPFEFSPHYESRRSVDAELKEYSKKKENPIYACADGEGIIVKNGKIHFVGKVKAFHRGRKFLVN